MFKTPQNKGAINTSGICPLITVKQLEKSLRVDITVLFSRRDIYGYKVPVDYTWKLHRDLYRGRWRPQVVGGGWVFPSLPSKPL